MFYVGLPTFRNYLERETSSAKHKNPPEWDLGPSIGTSRGKALDRGPKQLPPCVRKFVFAEVKCIISGPYK